MDSKRSVVIVCALYLVLIAGSAALLVAQSQPRGIAPAPVDWPKIGDRPLLTPEQAAQARETGTAAFSCAGKSYIVAGLPAEYTRED